MFKNVETYIKKKWGWRKYSRGGKGRVMGSSSYGKEELWGEETYGEKYEGGGVVERSAEKDNVQSIFKN